MSVFLNDCVVSHVDYHEIYIHMSILHILTCSWTLVHGLLFMDSCSLSLTFSHFLQTPDQRIAELTSINQSLSCLGNCIRALEKGSAHIPYRDSKLTRLLEDSLGGNTKTSFVVTLSPSEVKEIQVYFSSSFFFLLFPSSFFIFIIFICKPYLVLHFFITHTI